MSELASEAPKLGARAATRRGPSVVVRCATGLAAGVSAALALHHVGVGGRGFVAMAFVLVLGLLTVTDLEQRRIPNRIVLPATVAILAGNISVSPGRTPELIAAALGTAVFLFLPSVVRAAAMGMGDVKLGLLLGSGLGAHVVVALLVASLAVWPLAFGLTIRHGRRAARTTGIPFGPFLALGAVVALLTT